MRIIAATLALLLGLAQESSRPGCPTYRPTAPTTREDLLLRLLTAGVNVDLPTLITHPRGFRLLVPRGFRYVTADDQTLFLAVSDDVRIAVTEVPEPVSPRFALDVACAELETFDPGLRVGRVRILRREETLLFRRSFEMTRKGVSLRGDLLAAPTATSVLVLTIAIRVDAVQERWPGLRAVQRSFRVIAA